MQIFHRNGFLFSIIIIMLFVQHCMPDPRYRADGGVRINTDTPNETQSPVRSKSSERGLASFMGKELEGRKTANGENFNMWAMAAAHKTLPFGTIVRVTNLENEKTVDVRINDRGPFVRGRIIDLTYAAAQKLDFIDQGLAKVEIIVIKPVQK